MDWWPLRRWQGNILLTQRISIGHTREIINAIHSGELAKAEFKTLPIFNLQYPTNIEGVNPKILNPEDSWQSKDEFKETLEKVASMFRENFKKFTNDASEQVKAGGPH